jgi:hypothetical protein
MLKIEYEIRLNESGRPYIHLPKDYRDNSQDRFFALELSRYMLQMLYARRSAKFDEESSKAMEATLNTLEMISDEVAVLLRQEMEFLGDTTMMFQQNYHLKVKNIEERDALNMEGIVRGDKILKRQEGFKVFVEEEDKIYMLKDGIDNENWIEL